MAAKKKYLLQRVVYRKASSAVRRWRATPLKEATPRKLKIFTNVQSASVAGIARVMSSFAKHLNASPEVLVELTYASVLPNELQKKGIGWKVEKHAGSHHTSLIYQGVLAEFKDVLQSASTVNDVQSAHQQLVDAYGERLKIEEPDLVLVNGTYIVAWALMTAARRLRLPVVLYYHGSLTKETEHWKDPKHRRLMRHLELSFDRADLKYVFPSNLIKQYVERSVFGHTIRRGRSIVVPNPIPEEFFNAPTPKHKHGVAFVGRWTRIKNTAFITKFVGLNRYAKTPLEIFLVTDQAGRVKANKVLHRRIRFAGPFAASKEMRRFYAERAVVLCPSYFETYGNVAQEAVASGTPALVSRHMGVAEVFKSVGLGRLIVNFADPKKIFELVEQGKVPRVTNSAREALHKIAGEHVVHQKLLEFIRP